MANATFIILSEIKCICKVAIGMEVTGLCYLKKGKHP